VSEQLEATPHVKPLSGQSIIDKDISDIKVVIRSLAKTHWPDRELWIDESEDWAEFTEELEALFGALLQAATGMASDKHGKAGDATRNSA